MYFVRGIAKCTRIVIYNIISSSESRLEAMFISAIFPKTIVSKETSLAIRFRILKDKHELHAKQWNIGI